MLIICKIRKHFSNILVFEFTSPVSLQQWYVFQACRASFLFFFFLDVRESFRYLAKHRTFAINSFWCQLCDDITHPGVHFRRAEGSFRGIWFDISLVLCSYESDWMILVKIRARYGTFLTFNTQFMLPFELKVPNQKVFLIWRDKRWIDWNVLHRQNALCEQSDHWQIPFVPSQLFDHVLSFFRKKKHSVTSVSSESFSHLECPSSIAPNWRGDLSFDEWVGFAHSRTDIGAPYWYSWGGTLRATGSG